ncbi:MAG: ATP-binding cassette domain-containing protein [Bdellovibrionales bacterium]|nr:ATP-binding cassette domain-containing protein [Bdellovibrionales bacterium]
MAVKENDKDLSTRDLAVEVVDLKKSFNGTDFVLNGIDLKIPRGKITVIIGFSGTGKSVLLRHMLGLVKPTSGQIKILGRDLTHLSHDEAIELRMKFGVLFQYAALFDDMSVLENVMFPLNEHRRDLSKTQKLEIAYDKLKLAGLDEKHYSKLPSEISGGMRKRCGLARALALDPAILIYDEPTTGLDPVLTEMVDNLILNTHNHNKGSSSIVVSHDLPAAFRIGDYIVMLDSGKVILHGPPKVFFDTEIPLVKKFVGMGVRRS